MSTHESCAWLCGAGDFTLAAAAPPLTPFAPPVMAFLEALSAALLEDKALRIPTYRSGLFLPQGNLEKHRG